MDWKNFNHVMLMFLISQCTNHVMVRCVITDVRLFGGPSLNKGTVEIRQDNGSWETTCGTNFDATDVIVICKQLGFKGASIAIKNSSYDQTASPPTSGLLCTGDEAYLSNCTVVDVGCSLKVGAAASCHGEGYLGCFVDPHNDDRVLSGSSKVNDTMMTIPECITFCKALSTSNYVYAGVEHGDECYCGEDSDNYDQHGKKSDSMCQVPCKGDPTESCGSPGHIAVFSISEIMLTSTPTTSPMISSGQIDQSSITVEVNSSVMQTESTILTSPKGRSVLPRSGSDVGLYGGIGGGVGFVIIVVIIIAIILLIRRRSRYRPKDPMSPRIMESSPPSPPVNTNDYGITHATMQHTSGAGASSVNRNSGNRTTASAAASGEDKQRFVNKRQTMNVYEGIINDPPGNEIEPYASIEGFGATSATPNKPERMSVVYAAPDKSGNGTRNGTSENFGPLYSMPEKARGEPDGYEEKKPQVLYAMPDKSSSRDQYESSMVENELYTM